jgi:hypothetical protein
LIDSSFVVCTRKLNGLKKEGDAPRVSILYNESMRV